MAGTFQTPTGLNRWSAFGCAFDPSDNSARERAPQAPADRHDARQRRVERFAGKELTTQNVRRAAARKAVQDRDISQRRACRLVGVTPKTVRRDKPPDNPEVREEMQAIAAVRRWFGCRRIVVRFERKEMVMNHKKLYPLLPEEKRGVKR